MPLYFLNTISSSVSGNPSLCGSVVNRSCPAVHPKPIVLNHNSSSDSSVDANYGKLVMFSSDAEFVAGAHALLNKDRELGRGGFGVVYRIVLRDGRSVTIKKLTVASLIKSQEDFEREVKKLGKIRHHNLVALEGYY